MTPATVARSEGTTTSRSTIDAMISTSYGVRFFDRASLMSTVARFISYACTWRSTRNATVVSRPMPYVAGNRNPSSEVAAVRPASRAPSGPGLVRSRYSCPDKLVFSSSSRAMSSRRRPSGKVSGVGAGTVAGAGAGSRATLHATTPPTTTSAATASSPRSRRRPAWRRRRRTSWRSHSRCPVIGVPGTPRAARRRRGCRRWSRCPTPPRGARPRRS